MSVDKAIDLIDNSAKDKDPNIYKMNLLARTLKSNKMMPDFLDELMDFYGWIKTQNQKIQDEVWMPYFKSFVVAVESTSSESGWLLDIITQTRVKYSGNNPEARKFSLLRGQQKSQEAESMH